MKGKEEKSREKCGDYCLEINGGVKAVMVLSIAINLLS